MRVRLKTLLPALVDAMGGQEQELEFDGRTVGDLMDHLVARYGIAARKALCDRSGAFDPVVQVLVNENEWVAHDRFDTPLSDGDTVMLMMLMAGG